MDFSNFGFQEVPGLFSPEMTSNVRNQMMLSAAAGLIKGGGPSATPNFLGAFGDGLTGALAGRTEAQTAAYKQLLQSEQVKKLAEERAQRERWAQVFGVGGGAPTMPPGVMSPPVDQSAPQEAPQQGIPQGVMSSPQTNPQPSPMDNAAWPVGPAGAPSQTVPALPSRTQAAVRADAGVNLQTVLANMPPAQRQMIAMMGPTKGMEALATYVGKKFDKPSDSFLTVRDAEGNLKSYRADSPTLDAAITNGGTVVTTPPSKEGELVSLKGVDGVIRSYRKDDPAIDSVLANGGTQVTTISSNPNDHTKKPDSYLLPSGVTVLSADGRTYQDADGATKQIPQTGTIKLGADTAYESSRAAKVEARAQAALDAAAGATAVPRPPAEDPTSKGTGPWSALKGATDAVVGGLGVDQAFGAKGVFPQTTANRQYLRNLRQVAKTAMVNNPRFPVAEQKNVDELFPDPDSFWTNPHSEAQKIPIMRNMLNENLTANNEAIAGGGLTKEERSKLTSNNIEIKRALRLVGEGDASLDALGPTTAAASAAAGGANSWARVQTNQIVIQGGKRYKKLADGTAQEVTN